MGRVPIWNYLSGRVPLELLVGEGPDGEGPDLELLVGEGPDGWYNSRLRTLGRFLVRLRKLMRASFMKEGVAREGGRRS